VQGPDEEQSPKRRCPYRRVIPSQLYQTFHLSALFLPSLSLQAGPSTGSRGQAELGLGGGSGSDEGDDASEHAAAGGSGRARDRIDGRKSMGGWAGSPTSRCDMCSGIIKHIKRKRADMTAGDGAAGTEDCQPACLTHQRLVQVHDEQLDCFITDVLKMDKGDIKAASGNPSSYRAAPATEL
jgi:hypothetical protein